MHRALKQTVGKYFKNIDTKEVNALVVGTPTISNGVVSGFSSSIYLLLHTAFAPGSYTWEMVWKIKTGSDVSASQDFFAKSTSVYSPIIRLASKTMRLYLSSNGTSWNIANNKAGTYNYLANTNYWIKLRFTGSQYILSYSTNGTTFTDDITIASTAAICAGCVSVGNQATDNGKYFRGSMDLTASYIKINNSIWWQGTIIKPQVSTSSNYDYFQNVNEWKVQGKTARHYYEIQTQIYNEDKTPTPISLYNYDTGSDMGDDQNYWNWGMHGGVFGFALGSGFYGYSYHNGGSCGMQGGQTNNISYTFDNPLPPGTYQFKYGAYTANGATYTNYKLYYTSGGIEVEVPLPKTPSTSTWNYTAEFTVTEPITKIRAYTPTTVYKWGIGAVHLIFIRTDEPVEVPAGHSYDYFKDTFDYTSFSY